MQHTQKNESNQLNRSNIFNEKKATYAPNEAYVTAQQTNNLSIWHVYQEWYIFTKKNATE